MSSGFKVMGCDQTRTILLVDDDHVTRLAFTRALQNLRLDIELVTVEDGVDALNYLNGAIARNHGVLPPLIILLDIHMPRMTGPEFCDALSRICGFDKLVIYAFGSPDMPAAFSSVLDTHVTGYLTKDKPLETLTSVLQSEALPLLQ